MGMGLALEVPEPDFLAVGEEDERNPKLDGVVAGPASRRLAGR